MGEFIELRDGTRFKYAVVDDCRYIRRSEAEFLLYFDVHPEKELQRSLQDEHCLWRFPFPVEDNRTLEDVWGCTMADRVTFTVPSELVFKDHDEVIVNIKPKNSFHGVNRMLPCPLSKEDPGYGVCVARNIVDIVGERHDAGGARTILACSYCDKHFSAGVDEIEAYRQAYIAGSSWYDHPAQEYVGVARAELTAARMLPNHGGVVVGK